MSPRHYFAPKVWKRPYTSIYNDNYRYGNSLYSSAIDDIERKYNESLARTSFRPDRPDLHFETFADQKRPSHPSLDVGSFRRPNQDLDLNDSSTNRSRIAQSSLQSSNFDLKPSESFNAYQSVKDLASMEADLEDSRTRRRRKRAEDKSFLSDDIKYSSTNYRHTSPSNPPPLDAQNQALWTERWYNRSLRSVRPSLNRLT